VKLLPLAGRSLSAQSRCSSVGALSQGIQALAQGLSTLHMTDVLVWLQASLPRSCLTHMYEAACLSHTISTAERCPRHIEALMHLASSMLFKLC